jgi:Fe-S cluster assembly protein SufD
MNTQSSPRQWFSDIVAQNNALLANDANAPWLNQAREHASQAIGEIVLPERKQESWRYSDLSRLYQQQYHYPTTPVDAVPDDAVENWIYSAEHSHRLVFVNGQFVSRLSRIHALPAGVSIGSLRDILTTSPERIASWLRRHDAGRTDVFDQLNRAFINDGLFIHVPVNVQLEHAIEVVYLSVANTQSLLCQPRSLVILEDGARAKLVERFIGSGPNAYFFNGVTELSLGANAALQHYRLQNESSRAHHISRVELRQQGASEYHGVNIATGATWSRTDINARFEGPHAVCELDGLYTVGDGQYNDFHLDVLHNLPHCHSREDFKGIVYGNGRAVFDGMILVEKDAQKTDAQLSNKNLLLSQNGEVDTKPQLEIHADDVKCSHGTTVGKLDPNQLFYLRSRGIDQHQARQMICLGFAEQVLSRFDDGAVHDFVHNEMADVFMQPEAAS